MCLNLAERNKWIWYNDFFFLLGEWRLEVINHFKMCSHQGPLWMTKINSGYCKTWVSCCIHSFLRETITYPSLISTLKLYRHDWLNTSIFYAISYPYPNLTLQWRHNDHDCVSNHQPRGCLLNRLFRRTSKKTSKLRVTGLCVGNSPGPVNSPHKGPVTRKMFPFDDVIMNDGLSDPDKRNPSH